MPPANADPGSAVVTIRLATPADFQHIQELLSIRDGRTWDRRSVEWSLCSLDPEQCVAWLAFEGERAVGLSAMLVRDLQWQGEARRVGYWANLFILPSHRQLMIYPRLPLAMFEHVKRRNMAFLYCAVRLPDLVSAHLRIGFAKLGEIKVLFKPLRPVRLLAKAREWPAWSRTLAGPVDAVWERFSVSAAAADVSIVAVDTSSSDVSDVVAMLNEDGTRRVSQKWTERTFTHRYCQTREGGRYRIFLARRQEHLAAAVVYCRTERGPGIAAGVIVDIVARSMRDPAVAAAVAAAHRQASTDECDVVIYLNGLGPDEEMLVRSMGYRDSPEIYQVLIWPKALAAEPPLADLSAWRLSFADHDAF